MEGGYHASIARSVTKADSTVRTGAPQGTRASRLRPRALFSPHAAAYPPGRVHRAVSPKKPRIDCPVMATWLSRLWKRYERATALFIAVVLATAVLATLYVFYGSWRVGI